jgi:Domain of unknown function (DUF4333)
MTRKLALLAVAPLLLVACGETEIDAGKTEALIKNGVAGPEPRDVECPDGIEAQKGATFRCDVTYAQGIPPAEVTVHIVDDEGRVRVGPGDLKSRE